MFAGFNLKMDSDLSEYKERGMSIFYNSKKHVEAEIDKFLLGDGSINGSEMQSNWFPQVIADIFISHSHKDEENAIALAGWLNQKFGLDVFIDSCVWGYSEKLLKKIDDIYCINDGGLTYSYEKRNFSTSHVHMMLSTALTMMMDKTECIFFLNTPNSIDTSDVINRTKSPWIYYEIGMTKLVRRKSPEKHREQQLLKRGLFENAQALTIKYNVSLDHLCEITYSDLQEWELTQALNREPHPLNTLYKLNKLVEMHPTK